MLASSYPLASYTRAEAQAPVKGAQPKWGKQQVGPPALRVTLEEGVRDDGWEGRQPTAVLRVLQQRAAGPEVCLDAIYLHRFREGGKVVGLAARVQGSQLQVRWSVSKSPDLFRRFQVAFPSPSDCAAFVDRVGPALLTTVLPELPTGAGAAGKGTGAGGKPQGKRRKTAAEEGGPKKRQREASSLVEGTGGGGGTDASGTTSVQRQVAGPSVGDGQDASHFAPRSVDSVGPPPPLTRAPALVINVAPALLPPPPPTNTHVHDHLRSVAPLLRRPDTRAALPAVSAPAPTPDMPPPPPPPRSPMVPQALPEDLIDLSSSPSRAPISTSAPHAHAPSPGRPALPAPLEPSRPAPLVDLATAAAAPSPAAAVVPSPAALCLLGGVHALDDRALRDVLADVLADDAFGALLARVERALAE